jgi:hypothetical protein
MTELYPIICVFVDLINKRNCVVEIIQDGIMPFLFFVVWEAPEGFTMNPKMIRINIWKGQLQNVI